MPSIRDDSKEKDKVNKEVADIILKTKEPPVARFRLLSKGMEPYHRLYIQDPESDVTVTRHVLLAVIASTHALCSGETPNASTRRSKGRRLRWNPAWVRIASSATLCSCLSSGGHGLQRLYRGRGDSETIQPAPRITALDNYFMALIALILGVVIGVFVAR